MDRSGHSSSSPGKARLSPRAGNAPWKPLRLFMRFEGKLELYLIEFKMIHFKRSLNHDMHCTTQFTTIVYLGFPKLLLIFLILEHSGHRVSAC